MRAGKAESGEGKTVKVMTKGEVGTRRLGGSEQEMKSLRALPENIVLVSHNAALWSHNASGKFFIGVGEKPISKRNK